MDKIGIVESSLFFMERQNFNRCSFSEEDYLERIRRLLDKMNADNISHVLIYGNREHFSNIEYFSGYDCRFEEALLIIDSSGKKRILVGNEGLSYSMLIPYEIDRVLYQHFSLQGQPRDDSESLYDIFRKSGVSSSSHVGVIGYKYFEPKYFDNPENTYDIPAYILDEIKKAAENGRIINYTGVLTGLPEGLRMKMYIPKEIAWSEYAAGKCSNIILNMLDALSVDETELSVTSKSKAELHPQTVHPMINFGSHVATGLRSPDETRLQPGQGCGLTYGMRGSLVSRVGVAAYDFESYDEPLKPYMESFYKPFWGAIAAWYETVQAGVSGGEVYNAVMSRVGSSDFGVTLNPGHNIGSNEWVNSPIYKDSNLVIGSGSHLQCDIIASGSDPARCAICEDTVVIADNELRKRLKEEYPEVYARVINRQKMMRSILGIKIDDSVLPMSNLNGVYFPFMLNTGKIFSKLN
jgi:hypothetical protein